MNSINGVHTADHAIPPLGPDLEALFEDLAAVQDPGADQILAGLSYLLLTPYTVDETQTRIAWLAGGSDGTNLIALIGAAVARMASAASNPALRDLPPTQQKIAQANGEVTQFVLTNPTLAQFAADTAAAIDGT